MNFEIEERKENIAKLKAETAWLQSKKTLEETRALLYGLTVFIGLVSLLVTIVNVIGE